MRAFLLLALLALPLQAQTLPDTGTLRFEVDGVRIIHRQTNNNLVVANLYLLGGVQLATPQTAGLETMLLEISERGSARYPGDQLRRAMARTGSEIGVVAHPDWTVFGLRTTTDHLDSTWSIYTDRLMRPALQPADIEFVRENRAAALDQRSDSPDALLEYLADSVAFVGHPYGLSPVGTSASVRAITREQMLDMGAREGMPLVLSCSGDVAMPTDAQERIDRADDIIAAPHSSRSTVRPRRAGCPPTISSDGTRVRPPTTPTCRRSAWRTRSSPAASSARFARGATSRTPWRRASAIKR